MPTITYSFHHHGAKCSKLITRKAQDKLQWAQMLANAIDENSSVLDNLGANALQPGPTACDCAHSLLLHRAPPPHPNSLLPGVNEAKWGVDEREGEKSREKGRQKGKKEKSKGDE